MVWVEDWGSFALAARDLFLHSPTTARLGVKYRRSDSLLCVKVTDDKSCVQYRVTSPSELFKVDRLCSAFVSWAAAKEPTKDSPVFSMENLLAAQTHPPAARPRKGPKKPQQQRGPRQQQHAG